MVGHHIVNKYSQNRIYRIVEFQLDKDCSMMLERYNLKEKQDIVNLLGDGNTTFTISKKRREIWEKRGFTSKKIFEADVVNVNRKDAEY